MGRASFLSWKSIGVVGFVAVVSLLFYVAFFKLWPAIEESREDRRCESCHGQMLKLGLALLEYHDVHGHFPPAYIEGPDGTPWHSWRVLILPHLFSPHQQLYDQYRFDEPWNGPNNSKLVDRMCSDIFQCPGGPNCGKNLLTDYCVVVGESTPFPGVEAASLPDFSERTKQTILVVEVANSDIHWMEPRDLSIDDLMPKTGPRFGSAHPVGVNVITVDGKYGPLKDVSVEDLVELLKFSPGADSETEAVPE